ncbi:flagellar basal-body MS-ring/collar protein FliF [Paenibacillus taiwanensis]|uniref:flagellar basal-body MS-ring/collar protein FliF n=1 Tax=Paenibacillus taiwanensis TaxID=401638 RepID=UPI000490CAC1|nr:flagellar basal-body MS-ring/collar protein FliF [Paenibacillus taiwanensis]
MKEKIGQYRERASQYWSQFGKRTKWILISTLVLLVVAISLITYQLSKTEYALAFRDLNSNDAAGIIEYLNSNKIPYELSADGSSISVPEASASKVKVDIGAQGIVKNGSIGFDSFGADGLMGGMTDNVFDVRYKDALNGEIERLLRNMQGINDAQVLVNLPKESVFATNEEQQASASVLLKFKPGYSPKQEVVDGYFNLVKSAVPNLTAENITLSSDEGPMYASGSPGSGKSGIASEVEEQLVIQRRYERDLGDKVRSFLAGVVGPDNANVLVSANLNFDKVNKEENMVTPVDAENMKGIEISVQEMQETFTGKSAQQGVAGTGNEDVTNYPGATGNGDTSSEKSQKTVNYEVNRIKNLIQSSPYAVKDLTIHAAVGSSDLTDEKLKSVEKVLRSIVAAQLKESGSTITDAELEGKVSVISQNGTNGGVLSTTSIPTWVWYGAGALALLLIGGGIAFAVARKRKKREEEFIDEDGMGYIPTHVELPSIDLEYATNENQVRKQLESLAKKKPEEFVNLLRTWLVDESR